MHSCLPARTNSRMRVCTHAQRLRARMCTDTHTCTHTCMHAHVHQLRMHAHAQERTCIHAHTCNHTHKHTHTRMYARTHVHAHKHACTRECLNYLWARTHVAERFGGCTSRKIIWILSGSVSCVRSFRRYGVSQQQNRFYQLTFVVYCSAFRPKSRVYLLSIF